MDQELHLVSSLGWNSLARTLLGRCEEQATNLSVAFVGRSCSAIERERLEELSNAGATITRIPHRHAWDPFASRQVRRLIRLVQPTRITAWDAAAKKLAPRSADLVTGSRDEVACFAAEQVAAHADGDRADVLAKYDLPPIKRIIGVFAPLWPDENIKEHIWAADLLRVLNNDVAMVIVGDGPHLDVLQHFAATATEIDPIRFVPDHLDAERLVPHLEQLWHAGTETSAPYSIALAMMAGVPVVADDTPGARQLITHGETGFLSPRSDRAARGKLAQQLWTDADLRSRITAAAQQTKRERLLAPN